MEIKNRIGLPRMPFHVMNRGARKVAIFADDQDRALFVKLLGLFALKHEVKVISWCLMPNHYHVEPESEGTPLSRMMHDLDGTYAHAYNERHDTTGCLFQGPYKSFSVRDAGGLAYVSRYIHANSRDLKIRPQDYPWSSCRSYLGLEPTPRWLDPSPVLDLWSNRGDSPAACYRKYLEAVPPKRRISTRRGEEGDDFYLEFLRHVEERCSEWMVILGDLMGRITLQTFLCWVATRVYKIAPRWVAEFYGYESGETVRSIAGRFQKRMEDSPELWEAVETVTKTATLKR